MIEITSNGININASIEYVSFNRYSDIIFGIIDKIKVIDLCKIVCEYCKETIEEVFDKYNYITDF